jgi:hypothetical protein
VVRKIQKTFQRDWRAATRGRRRKAAPEKSVRKAA